MNFLESIPNGIFNIGTRLGSITQDWNRVPTIYDFEFWKL